MPRGFKVVNWTDPSNDAKLLVSVLKHVDVSKQYGEIAKDFGEHVPAQCIQLRISKIKKMVNDGKTANSTPKGATGKAATTTSNKGKAGGRGKKATTNESEDESMDDDALNVSQSMTPPKTPTGTTANNKTLSGRVTKARIPPRKKVKTDYKKMEDPFEDMKDATDQDGEAMSHAEKSEGEDSSLTDVEFGRERAVKVERADDAI